MFHRDLIRNQKTAQIVSQSLKVISQDRKPVESNKHPK